MMHGVFLQGPTMSTPPDAQLTLDLSGLNCPLPILRAKKALADLPGGTVIHLICTDPGTPSDFEAFCRQTGHTLAHHARSEDGKFLFWIARRAQ
jgi:tRNA 2-thiouridine synthesizing protein A